MQPDAAAARRIGYDMSNANGHPIEGLMNTAMQKIKEMVDVNTIIGTPITADGATIIPVSKVAFGFGSGGSDFPSKVPSTELFGGGSGAGVTIQPVAFIVIKNDDVRLLQIATSSNTTDKLVNLIPDVVDKISGIIHDKKEKNNACAPNVYDPLENDPLA